MITGVPSIESSNSERRSRQHMSIEMLVDTTLSAIASAATNNVWPAARDRLALVFRPNHPDEESAQLDELFNKLLHTNPTDKGRHKELIQAYVQDRLRQHPEREWAWVLSVTIEEIRQIIFETENAEVHTNTPQATVNIHNR